MDVAARLVWMAVVMVGLMGCAEGREVRRCSGKIAMGMQANAEDVRAADGWRGGDEGGGAVDYFPSDVWVVE